MSLKEEYAAYESRMSEARKAGLMGRPFTAFCEFERIAQHVAQREIAGRYGFNTFEIYP